MGTVHVDLSLRMSSEGTGIGESRFENVEDLQPNKEVKGYVKNVTPKGCFIMLSKNLDAKILLGNLSDGYVQDPAKEFPVGKLVTGKILSVEPLSKRVEVTLKVADKNSTRQSESGDMSSLHIGDVIKGRIKRVESFGLFIVIDNTNLVGLCHVSEISDSRIKDIDEKFRAGQRVTAKILKVDAERHRISLGMKASYFEDEDHEVSTSSHDSGEEMEADLDGDSVAKLRLGDDIPQSSNSDSELKLEEGSALDQVESRASVPPLEVVLDDMEEDDVAGQPDNTEIDPDNGGENLDEKSKRLAKRKAKEEKERHIRAAEQRLLEKDAPRTTDEFEKAVRTSPNSSFVWIKYMQFMLSMADVEGARSVAERY